MEPRLCNRLKRLVSVVENNLEEINLALNQKDKSRDDREEIRDLVLEQIGYLQMIQARIEADLAGKN